MPSCLILGGADCVTEDYQQALYMLGEFDAYMAVNDMIADWPMRLDYAVTLHPEKLHKWLHLKTERNPQKYPPQVWCHKLNGSPRVKIDRQTRDLGGSSGLLAVKIAVEEEKFTRVVLAGVPMTKTPHYFDRAEWGTANSFWQPWLKNVDRFRGLVRSMSGRTRDLFGEPTLAWFRDIDSFNT